MHRLTLKQIQEATNGKIISGNESIFADSICIDSRQVQNNSLFVCIKGENTDGHNYIESAFSQGASIILTEKEIPFDEKRGAVLVEDSVYALGRLSKYYKEQFNLKTIAITGSVGKTTTKDMMFSVMASQYHTLKTEGNFNNEIGLPLTAMRLTSSHEAAVFEMGMSAFGEIHYLADIARPDVAVITNIGMSHIENLGSQEGIFKAKMEICDFFDKNNLLVVNGDDKYLIKSKDNKKINVITYGIENPECDYLAYDIENMGIGGTKFKTKIYEKEYTIHIKVPGVHNVYNALAAIICGVHYNISPQRIVDGIEEFALTKMRMSIEKAKDMTIINDCYNSSPDSVKAALKVLATQNTRRVAILGDILEMGEYAKDAHTQIGKWVVQNGVDLLIAVGNNAEFMADGAQDAGIDCEKIKIFSTTEEACEEIGELVKPEDSILIKASRGMHFELITKTLTE